MDALFPYWVLLLVAFALDLFLGDPLWLPHPVRWMGRVIQAGEPWFRQLPVSLIRSGGLFVFALILGTWGLSWLLLKLVLLVHPLLHDLFETILIFYCLSAGSLAAAAMEVSGTLKNQGLGPARQKLGLIVGRDVDRLTETGVIQGTVETVAENFVDGFLAPVFFAALGGAPLALAYKMVNTLDSMLGYKNETYSEFGRFAARLDDAMNYIPARLSMLIISLGSFVLWGRFQSTLQTAITEGKNHSSPNAGLPEAAFAGALGIRLGGPNCYQGQLLDKPFIGLAFEAPGLDQIAPSCTLMLLSALIWVLMVASVLLLF